MRPVAALAVVVAFAGCSEGTGRKQEPITTREIRSAAPNGVTAFGTVLAVRLSGGDVDGPASFEFSTVGNKGENGVLDEIWLRLEEPIGSQRPIYPTACPPSGTVRSETTRFNDGLYRVDLHAPLSGSTFRAGLADCTIATLPEEHARNLRIVVDRYRDFAKVMIEDGTIDSITNPAFRSWLVALANGQIRLE